MKLLHASIHVVHKRATLAASSRPPCGEGPGVGFASCGPGVPHGTTPHPNPPPTRQGNRIWRFLFGTTAPRAPPSRPLVGRVDASRSEAAGWGDYANCDVSVMSRTGQTPRWHTWPDGTRTTSIHQALIAAAAWRRGEHGVRVVPPPGAAARRHPPRHAKSGKPDFATQ